MGGLCHKSVLRCEFNSGLESTSTCERSTGGTLGTKILEVAESIRSLNRKDLLLFSVFKIQLC